MLGRESIKGLRYQGNLQPSLTRNIVVPDSVDFSRNPEKY